MPYSPTTLAACAMAIISIWLSPSATQGNPDSSVPRRYSPATQVAGASHRPAAPARASSTPSAAVPTDT